MEDLSTDLSLFLSTTLSPSASSSSSSDPILGLDLSQLIIIPGKKAWTLYVDAIVLAFEGNIHDALFIAVRSAIWDTRIPRTKSIAYTAPPSASKTSKSEPAPLGGSDPTGPVAEGDLDVFGIKGMVKSKAVDFELEDYWEEGDVLKGRDDLPVCVTLNIVSTSVNLHGFGARG